MPVAKVPFRYGNFKLSLYLRCKIPNAIFVADISVILGTNNCYDSAFVIRSRMNATGPPLAGKSESKDESNNRIIRTLVACKILDCLRSEKTRR